MDLEHLMKTDLLSHIAVNIFSQLSDKVLGECRRTNKAWKEFIDKQKFYYIRQLTNTKSKQPKFFSINKQWNTIVDKFDESQSLPDLKNMNVFLKHFFKTKQPEKHDPLEWTVSKNHIPWVKFLLNFVQDLDQVTYVGGGVLGRPSPFIDRNPRTPLMTACHHGYADIVKVLFDNCQGKKFNVNKRISKGSGQTAFIEACDRGSLEVVKLFLEYAKKLKIDLNMTDGDGNFNRNALSHAITCKEYKIVELLLQDPQIDVHSPHFTSFQFMTPFMAACEQGYYDVVQVVVKYVKPRKIDVNYRDDDFGMTAFIFSCGEGLDLTTNLLIQADIGIDANIGDIGGRTALHWACIRGQATTVELLLANAQKLKLNPNQRDNFGMTALMCAAKEKEFFVLKSFLRRAKEVTIDFNVKDTKYGRTAYIWSCIKGRQKDNIFQEFQLYAKKLKIDVNVKDKYGRTGSDYMRLSVNSGHFWHQSKHSKKFDEKTLLKYYAGNFGVSDAEKSESEKSESESEEEVSDSSSEYESEESEIESSENENENNENEPPELI